MLKLALSIYLITHLVDLSMNIAERHNNIIKSGLRRVRKCASDLIPDARVVTYYGLTKHTVTALNEIHTTHLHHSVMIAT